MKNFYLMISFFLVFDLGFLVFLLFISIAMSVSTSNPMQGGSESHSIHCQRRRWFEIVISGLIIPTYLQFSNSRQWQPAKPSTGMSFFNLFQTKQLYEFRNLTELHQNQRILRART